VPPHAAEDAATVGEPTVAAPAGDWPVIPGYEVLERLGRGGMGQVFKARHLRLDRIIALKIIRKDRQAQFQAVRRFQREAKAAGRLSHPNIVAFHEADMAGEIHFLTMEYVEGTDLTRVVERDGPLPVGRACDCVWQAALGLQHAHERGLVHRDIKPSNLMLGCDGVVKILDMGLARLEQGGPTEHASSELTQTGAVMGTPAYMAPEQALDPRRADIRADIYSLGCTFYYLLTGRVPFVHVSMTQVLLQHQLEEPAALEQLRPEVSGGLATVVRRMMAKRREDRYQTAAEVAATVGSFCCLDGAVPAQSRLHAIGGGGVACASAGAATRPADVAADCIREGSGAAVASSEPAERPKTGPSLHRRIYLRLGFKGCSLTIALMSIAMLVVGVTIITFKEHLKQIATPPSVAEKVRVLINEKEYSKALDAMENGEQLPPNERQALRDEVRHAWLSQVNELAREDKPGALALLNDLLKAMPFQDDPEGLALRRQLVGDLAKRAEELIDQGKFAEALPTLEAGTDSTLGDEKRKALRGRLRELWLGQVTERARDDKQGALGLLDEFDKRFPDDPEALTLRRKVAGELAAQSADDEVNRAVAKSQSPRPEDRAAGIASIRHLLGQAKSTSQQMRLCDALADIADRAEKYPQHLDAVRQALTGVNLPVEAVSYTRYISALCQERDGNLPAAADELLQVFAGQEAPPVLEGKPARKERVADILRRGALLLREGGSFDLPFANTDDENLNRANATRAYVLLKRSGDLLTPAQLNANHELAVNLALAAWHKTPPDAETALRWSSALLEKPRAKDIKAEDLTALLLVSAGARSAKRGDVEARKAALDDYGELVDRLAPKGDEVDAAAALLVSRAVLTPAIALAGGDASAARPLARFCATQARLIAENPDAKWPFANQWQKVFELYDTAAKGDGAEASYFAGRGNAAARLAETASKPDWAAVRRDADEAIRLARHSLEGHELLGYVLLQQSRDELDEEKQRTALEEAVAAYETALTAAEGPDGKGASPSLLTNVSSAYLALGNFVSDKEKRRKYLSLARDRSLAATRPSWRRRDFAWEALGNAQEDLAWLLGDTALYEEAATAFGKAVSFRPQEPRYLIDRGRVQYRWAKYGGSKDPECLNSAEADLRAALALKPKSADEAQVHDLLGMVALHRGKDGEARAQFASAAGLADAASAKSTAYALQWMTAVRRGADRKAPTPKAAAVLAQAVRERAQKVQRVPEHRMAAGLLVGWSHELEDNPKEALDTYASLLPVEPTEYKASHIEAILARANVWWSAKLERRLRPTPEAIVQEAERAVKLARGGAVPKSTRGRAFGFAGQAWKEWGVERTAGPEMPRRLEKSLGYFRDAIQFAPDYTDCSMWRVELAAEIAYFLRTNAWDEATGDRAYQEAISHLEEALKTDRKNIQDQARDVQDDLKQLRKK
jgi:tRNA A-37 threonylcarbamoyl transferase component Bud32